MFNVIWYCGSIHYDVIIKVKLYVNNLVSTVHAVYFGIVCFQHLQEYLRQSGIPIDDEDKKG